MGLLNALHFERFAKRLSFGGGSVRSFFWHARVAPRTVVLYCSSREMQFREWNFALRESLSEIRELLREYPGALREIREWPFHPESVFFYFSEIGGGGGPGVQAREQANRALVKAILRLQNAFKIGVS